MRRVAVALLLPALALPGCVDIQAAHVPDGYLDASRSNGWTRNDTASQREPSSASMGFQKTWTLVYDDRGDGAGYPGVLVVTTLRAVPAPSEERIREHVEQTVRDQAAAKGIALGPTSSTGSRSLANGATSTYFVYSGNVSTSGFFARNAEVRIFGEVFRCDGPKTIVAVVGIAQVSDVKSVNPGPGIPGLPAPSGRDDTTWREIVADDTGRIEGIRGSDGLAYRVAC